MHFCSAGIQINSSLSSFVYNICLQHGPFTRHRAQPAESVLSTCFCNARRVVWAQRNLYAMIWELSKAWAVISTGGKREPAAQSAELLWLDLQTRKLSLATRCPSLPGSPFHSASFSNCKHWDGVTERSHPWRVLCLKSKKTAWM